MQLMERDAKTVPRGVTSPRQLQGRRCSFIKKKSISISGIVLVLLEFVLTSRLRSKTQISRQGRFMKIHEDK